MALGPLRVLAGVVSTLGIVPREVRTNTVVLSIIGDTMNQRGNQMTSNSDDLDCSCDYCCPLVNAGLKMFICLSRWAHITRYGIANTTEIR